VFALYLFSKKGKYLGPRLPNEDLGQRECQINEGQELENDADADYRGDMPKKE
jgi:hypothetical protein